jgi:hypothetical protein
MLQLCKFSTFFVSLCSQSSQERTKYALFLLDLLITNLCIFLFMQASMQQQPGGQLGPVDGRCYAGTGTKVTLV